MNGSDGVSQLTVMGWMKAGSWNTANSRIVANSHTDGDQTGFQLEVEARGSAGFFDVGDGRTSGMAYWSGHPLQLGRWYFYVGAFDGSTVSVYLDGALLAQVPYTPASGTLGAGLTDAAIGMNPVYQGDHFHGQVADVGIFPVSLDAGQVAPIDLSMEAVSIAASGALRLGTWLGDIHTQYHQIGRASCRERV